MSAERKTMWKIPSIVVCTATLLYSLPTAHAVPKSVLLVIADDLGVDKASFYPTSAGRFQTSPPPPPMPNLTALASRGVVFRNLWAEPECSPTRADIMTGRYGFRHGVQHFLRTASIHPDLPQAETTLPEVLKQANPTRLLASIGKFNLEYQNSGPVLHGWPYHNGVGSAQGGMPDYYHWQRTLATGSESAVSLKWSTVNAYATTDQVNVAVAKINEAKQAGKPYFISLGLSAAHSTYQMPRQTS
jgi:Sulfatase